MKRLVYDGPITLIDLEGNPVADRVEDGKPVYGVYSFPRFLRMLVSIPKFVENLDQIDALGMALDCKKKFDAAPEAGYLDVEDDIHKRLLAALKEWKAPVVWAYCLHPFALAVRDAKEPPAAPVLEQAVQAQASE